MHRHWIETIIHIVFWVSTTMLIANSFSIQSHEIEIVNDVEIVNIVRNNALIYQVLFCILVAFFLFYLNARIIYKLNLTNNKTAIGFSALSFFIASVIVFVATKLEFYDQVFLLPREIAYGIIAFYFAISVAYGLAKLWLQNQQRHQRLVLDQKQTELALLRNQLQPHFLFNALNNLLSMVRPSDNPKLNASITRLSELLRYVIDETKKVKVNISQEIDFLHSYIDLQLLRFSEDEVTVDFKVKGSYDTQMVEPGLFITFVENAFKYGTEPEKLTNIEIYFDLMKKDTIVFQIKNKVMLQNVSGNGTGIETTKKRLELIYPKTHHLSISEGVGEFLVELILETE